MNQRTWAIGVGTLVIFGLGGLALIYFYSGYSGILKVFTAGWLPLYQVLLGILVGGLSAGMGLVIITRPFFERHKQYYYHLIRSRLNLNARSILFLSLCAGVGEELFFRAGLQTWLGIWPTAIIFVALHGYLSPRSWRISLYGLFMTILMAGLGYLYEYTGLWTVIVAHSLFDIILFWHIAHYPAGETAAEHGSEPAPEEEEGTTHRP